jgi:hypothetical protein
VPQGFLSWRRVRFPVGEARKIPYELPFKPYKNILTDLSRIFRTEEYYFKNVFYFWYRMRHKDLPDSYLLASTIGEVFMPHPVFKFSIFFLI